MSLRRHLPLLLLVLLASCAPRREGVVRDSSGASALHLAAMVREAGDRITTLRASGTMAFDTPDMGGTAFFALSLRKPDSLLLRLEGPFGLDLGSLFLSRSRFVMYNSMENTVASGVPTEDALRRVVPVPLTYDQVLAAFSGSFPLPAMDPPVRSSVDDNLVVLTYSCGKDTCAFWIDPDLLLVRRYRTVDWTGATLFDVETSGVIEHGDRRVPRRVAVTMPLEQRKVTIVFSDVDFDADRLSFSFVVPPNARKLGGS